MEDRVWRDCPSCGTKNSMRRNELMTFKSPRFRLFIENLKGYECSKCHDGIYDQESSNKVEKMIKEAKSFK
jgi:YgiT-type zinc finger domain-containing protein